MNQTGESSGDEFGVLYRQYVPIYLEDLKQASRGRDFEGLRFQCHKLVTVMGIMEFFDIEAKIKSVQALEKQDPDLTVKCEELISMIEASLRNMDKTGDV